MELCGGNKDITIVTDNGVLSQRLHLEGRCNTWRIDSIPSFFGINSAAEIQSTFVGEFDGDGISRHTGVGDFNGDSYDDFYIVSGASDTGTTNAGEVYVFYGKEEKFGANISMAESNVSFHGEYSVSFPNDVSMKGDFNGDGYKDLLIANRVFPDVLTQYGKIYVILGSPSAWNNDLNVSNANYTFRGESNSNYLGFDLDFIGDFNNDGYDDIAVGAYGNDDFGGTSGKAYVLLGSSNNWGKDINISEANYSFHGERTSQFSSYAITGIGDFNNDGYDDFASGALEIQQDLQMLEKLYVILGSSNNWGTNINLSEANYSFEGAGRRVGGSLANMGDFNNDGFDDLFIGPQSESSGHFVFGSNTSWSKNVDLPSSSNGSLTFLPEISDGTGVGGGSVGDVNGDGFEDFIVSGRSNDNASSNAGQVYLLLGKTSDYPQKIQ